MIPFFITGLPRSRTGWLANLFTEGESFCYHDLLHELESLQELESRLYAPDRKFCGVSDSGILFVWKHLLELFPDAKFLVSVRNKDDALNSYTDYFSQHPYNGSVPVQYCDYATLFEGMDAEMFKIIDSPPSHRCMTFDFDSLNSYNMCTNLHHFITGKPLDRHRWELLNKLRVNPASEKITVNSARFEKLLNESFSATNLTL